MNKTTLLRRSKTVFAVAAAALPLLGAGAMPVLAQTPAQTTVATGGTALDTSAYSSVMSDVTASYQSAINGPGRNAIGVVLIGTIFAVVIRWVKKGGRQLSG